MKLVSFWCDIKYLDYILHVLGCSRVNLHVQVRISSDMFKKKKGYGTKDCNENIWYI